MNYRMSDIEGVGEVYADKLAAVGVRSTDQFLSRGATPKGRVELQEATGVSGKLILRWCNQADLMRISGVGPQFAELLEAAGVDTVKELSKRNADNLAERMVEVNNQKRLSKTSPAIATVRRWISQARMAEPVLKY